MSDPALPVTVHIVGARGTPGPVEDRLEAAKKRGSAHGVEVQLLDARYVCGRDHLVTAAEHAERAMREGRNAAKSLAVEFVLYASGERQISEAIAKMGIREDSTEFAVVQFGGEDPDAALEALGLTRDDDVLGASDEKIRAFGLMEPEIASVPEGQAADLVLERVALVDLLK